MFGIFTVNDEATEEEKSDTLTHSITRIITRVFTYLYCVYLFVLYLLIGTVFNLSKPSATALNIQQFYVLPTQCIYVFFVDLRTNSDYFPIQH